MKQKQIIAQELQSSQSALIKVDLKSGQTFTGAGVLEMALFPRLVEELLQSQSKTPFTVSWAMRSWVNELATGSDQYRLEIKAKTSLTLVCQRCLNDFEQPLVVHSQFLLLSTEEDVDQFPIENDNEDALLNSHEFNVLELLEDELLLAIPIVPKHDERDCQQHSLGLAVDLDKIDIKNNDLSPIKAERVNPFLQLKKLKLND